jgi:ergothioneine biosynthesis protein EgtB
MVTQSRSTILQQFHRRILEARENTDALFRIVREESLYERPIPERHRIIFYIGHLEAFDWNLFREHLFSRKFASTPFDRLFAFGIDPVDGGLPSDQPSDWPSLREVRGYVETMRDQIDDALGAEDFDGTKSPDGAAPETLLHVAIEHRLMHAETLAYMLHQLPYERKSAEAQGQVTAAHRENILLEIPSGKATLGLPRKGSSFGWDNEFEAYTVDVPSFRMQKYMVTNAEYLQFVADRGYENERFWSPEDWRWKEKSGIQHPAFWRRAGQSWNYRGMFEEFPLPGSWPVYVSHAEASAYARWSGQKLPSEAQWHRAAYGSRNGTEREYPWGSAPPKRTDGNFDFSRWDPAPVTAYPGNTSDFGVNGLAGNGWEWTSTLFAPFSGFRPLPFYEGYSANFFDNKHHVIKGGSPRTAACFLRRSFRNWFQPHYQYVYAGFRCVAE